MNNSLTAFKSINPEDGLLIFNFDKIETNKYLKKDLIRKKMEFNLNQSAINKLAFDYFTCLTKGDMKIIDQVKAKEGMCNPDYVNMVSKFTNVIMKHFYSHGVQAFCDLDLNKNKAYTDFIMDTTFVGILLKKIFRVNDVNIIIANNNDACNSGIRMYLKRNNVSNKDYEVKIDSNTSLPIYDKDTDMLIVVDYHYIKNMVKNAIHTVKSEAFVDNFHYSVEERIKTKLCNDLYGIIFESCYRFIRFVEFEKLTCEMYDEFLSKRFLNHDENTSNDSSCSVKCFEHQLIRDSLELFGIVWLKDSDNTDLNNKKYALNPLDFMDIFELNCSVVEALNCNFGIENFCEENKSQMWKLKRDYSNYDITRYYRNYTVLTWYYTRFLCYIVLFEALTTQQVISGSLLNRISEYFISSSNEEDNMLSTKMKLLYSATGDITLRRFVENSNIVF
jgi:hypothetical protein